MESTSFKNDCQRESDVSGHRRNRLTVGGKTIQVEPEGLNQINSVARVLFENSLGTDIQGNLYLESDQLISAWASQIDNATNDPSLLLSKRSQLNENSHSVGGEHFHVQLVSRHYERGIQYCAGGLEGPWNLR